MKIAYLLVAHTQPNHFKRLVKALVTEDAHCFVHIDAKADMRQFREGIDERNIFFLKDRIWVNHSGFTSAWAMLMLLEEALAVGRYDYFATISGQCYPVKSNGYIRNFLGAQGGVNFLNFYPLLDGAVQVENIRRYYCFDQIGSIRWLAPAGKRFLRGVVRAANLVLPQRTFPSGFVPYRGSAWWCLNRRTAEYVCAFVRTPEAGELMRFFRHVKAADEMFVHTVVMNSPFAEQCRFYERDVRDAREPMKNENAAYLHYVDWDPQREDPAILDERDFRALRESEFLFARKFEEEKSKVLLALIDEHRMK